MKTRSPYSSGHRTLYADGDWNTICLPFNTKIGQFDGVVAHTLTAASISGTTLNLTFGDHVDEIIAGTPYIIKYNKDANNQEEVRDLINPLFTAVTVNNATANYDNSVSGDLRVRFLGTYDAITFNATDKSILFMGDGNTLYYPEANASIGACRAYFKIGDGKSLAKQITAFNIDFGDEYPNGIEEIVNGKLLNGKSLGAWYDMSGRKLDSKPSRAGVYINNGKKMVIK